MADNPMKYGMEGLRTGLYDRVPTQVRKESYEKSKPKFSKQEQLILERIRIGQHTAWDIQSTSGMLITSVRRALNSLYKKDAIEVFGKVWHEETQRKTTYYRIKDAKN